MVVARGGFGQQNRGVFVEEPVGFHDEAGRDARHDRPVVFVLHATLPRPDSYLLWRRNVAFKACAKH